MTEALHLGSVPIKFMKKDRVGKSQYCSQRNGLITGYTVMISNSSITYNLNSTKRYIILNNLVFGTVYNISVAAVNSVGRGPFSDPMAIEIGIGM